MWSDLPLCRTPHGTATCFDSTEIGNATTRPRIDSIVCCRLQGRCLRLLLEIHGLFLPHSLHQILLALAFRKRNFARHHIFDSAAKAPHINCRLRGTTLSQKHFGRHEEAGALARHVPRKFGHCAAHCSQSKVGDFQSSLPYQEIVGLHVAVRGFFARVNKVETCHEVRASIYVRMNMHLSIFRSLFARSCLLTPTLTCRAVH